MNTWNRWESQPDALDDAIDDEIDDAAPTTGASYPDPWEGDHAIEYWVWHGDRLTPATPREVARIKEDERTRAALYRLGRMRQHERPVPRHVARMFLGLRAQGVHCLSMIARTLRSGDVGGRASHTKNVRAE